MTTVTDETRRRVSTFVPAVAAVAACAAILMRYGTPVASVGLFACYAVVLGVPGALLWRLTLGRRSLLEDVAAGLAIGLAVEALAAFALSPAGLADWSWGWSPLVIVVVIATPRLRHRASGGCQERQSAPAAWAVAVASVAAVLWLAATSFGSASDLASAMRRASVAHGEHEKRIGAADADWPDWYAQYMVAEQAGTELPT